jgi:hypothetical protein
MDRVSLKYLVKRDSYHFTPVKYLESQAVVVARCRLLLHNSGQIQPCNNLVRFVP